MQKPTFVSTQGFALLHCFVIVAVASLGMISVITVVIVVAVVIALF